MIKPGYRTTEFWTMLIGELVGFVQLIATPWHIPDKWTITIQGALAIAYKLSRGQAKQGAGLPNTVFPPDPTDHPTARGGNWK